MVRAQEKLLPNEEIKRLKRDLEYQYHVYQISPHNAIEYDILQGMLGLGTQSSINLYFFV